MSRPVLLIDPDAAARGRLASALEAAGLPVVQAETGVAGVRAARSRPPLLIASELDLPDGDGFDLCRELKRDFRASPVPFMFLAARSAEIDRVLAFELGAEDFVAKPFSVREVLLRIRRSVARRIDLAEEDSAELRVGRLTLDLVRGEARVGGKPVLLAAQEFRLLALLARRPGAIHTREKILRDAWNRADARDTRTIDTHLRRLRLKLGPAACYIENVRNMGFRLRPQALPKEKARENGNPDPDPTLASA
ncbi:MAG TPA: response regulator transcription factor [Candidatus Methylacidiphilales bacterium]